MSDPSQYISLRTAAQEMAGVASYASLYRWSTEGVRLEDGRIIKLQTHRIGRRRRMTRRVWLAEFIEAINTPPAPQADPEAPGYVSLPEAMKRLQEICKL